MNLIEYMASHVLAFVFVAALLGLIVGSFLNVVIHRLPRMMERDWKRQAEEILHPEVEQPELPIYNLILPHSHCPHCDAEIKPWQNLPLISYALLRGRCGNCRERISIRYPLVELLTAVLSGVVAWQFGFGWEAGAMLLLTWSLISLSLIDADTQLLPDSIVLPMLWLGLIINSTGLFTDIHSALWGAVFGYLSLWTVYWVFKLLAMLGAWGGWQVLPLTILLSSLVGAVLGIIILKSRGDSNATPLPFGPYLAIAGWIAIIWGDWITGSYLRFAGF